MPESGRMDGNACERPDFLKSISGNFIAKWLIKEETKQNNRISEGNNEIYL